MLRHHRHPDTAHWFPLWSAAAITAQHHLPQLDLASNHCKHETTSYHVSCTLTGKSFICLQEDYKGILCHVAHYSLVVDDTGWSAFIYYLLSGSRIFCDTYELGKYFGVLHVYSFKTHSGDAYGPGADGLWSIPEEKAPLVQTPGHCTLDPAIALGGDRCKLPLTPWQKCWLISHSQSTGHKPRSLSSEWQRKMICFYMLL